MLELTDGRQLETEVLDSLIGRFSEALSGGADTIAASQGQAGDGALLGSAVAPDSALAAAPPDAGEPCCA